jgi:hypothetical protein
MAACRAGGPPPADPSADPAVQRYGYGPRPDPSITYQPDVVLMENGPRAIRSVSANGLVWTIDRAEPGAADLQPGKIMFAASQAAGRIVRVDDRGGALEVTLAPVQLGEVIRDGRITTTHVVNLEAAGFQMLPDLIGEDPMAGVDLIQSADGGEWRITAPTIRLASAGRQPAGAPERPTGNALQASGSVGDWDLTASKDAGQISFTADRKVSGGRGLKVGLAVRLGVQNLTIHADVPIARGVVGPSTFRVDGIRSVALTIAAGASDGSADNRKARIELPIEISQPLIIGGFPAHMKQRFKFLIQTAFSAKNGNLSARGAWGLDGPMGFDGTTLTTPVFSVRESLMDSIQGVSVGVNGLVVATEFRFALGIGLPVAGAGPYASMIASVGVTKGSSIGMVQCHGGTLVLTLKGGVSVSLSTPLKTVLEKVLGVKVPDETELGRKDIVNVSQTRPDSKICSG